MIFTTDVITSALYSIFSCWYIINKRDIITSNVIFACQILKSRKVNSRTDICKLEENITSNNMLLIITPVVQIIGCNYFIKQCNIRIISYLIQKRLNQFLKYIRTFKFDYNKPSIIDLLIFLVLNFNYFLGNRKAKSQIFTTANWCTLHPVHKQTTECQNRIVHHSCFRPCQKLWFHLRQQVREIKQIKSGRIYITGNPNILIIYNLSSLFSPFVEKRREMAFKEIVLFSSLMVRTIFYNNYYLS